MKSRKKLLLPLTILAFLIAGGVWFYIINTQKLAKISHTNDLGITSETTEEDPGNVVQINEGDSRTLQERFDVFIKAIHNKEVIEDIPTYTQLIKDNKDLLNPPEILIDNPDRYMSPLAVMVGWRNPELIKIMLDNGADPNGSNVAERAITYGSINIEILRLLIDAGLSVEGMENAVKYKLLKDFYRSLGFTFYNLGAGSGVGEPYAILPELERLGLSIDSDQEILVELLESPQLLSDKAKICLPDGNAGQYKIGDVVSGKYKGGDYVLTILPYEYDAEGGIATDVVRSVIWNSKEYYLTRYNHKSRSADDPYSFCDLNEIADFSNLMISGLDLAITEEFSYKGFEYTYVGYGENLFEEMVSLRRVATIPSIGDVYVSDELIWPEMKMTNWSIFLKSPEGLILSYDMKPPLYQKINSNGDILEQTYNVPAVEWSNGSINQDPYSVDWPTAQCVSTNVTYMFDTIELEVAGAVGVDLPTAMLDKNIYTLIDTNHPILKGFYEHISYSPKLKGAYTYQEFLEDRPLFFARDSFGRYIGFFKTEYQYGC